MLVFGLVQVSIQEETEYEFRIRGIQPGTVLPDLALTTGVGNPDHECSETNIYSSQRERVPECQSPSLGASSSS